MAMPRPDKMKGQTILVTGGAGYIGTHVCVELLANGANVIVFDNLARSHRRALERVEALSGRSIVFVNGDVRDYQLLCDVFARSSVDAVIHLAGLKAVGESGQQPVLYYDNNVCGTVALCRAMQHGGVKQLVFSSSATVYGEPQFLPLTEAHPLAPTNPYGQSKLIVEMLLHDLHQSDSRWRIAVLRYFNPVGAHPSGMIGEDPRGTPGNLVPYLAQVAIGRQPSLTIFGDDYDTPDGTGLRDYIHVMDLAEAHVRALAFLSDATEILTANLGTGRGYTVLEVVAEFERASGKAIPCAVAGRRSGDVAACYADATLAGKVLDWRARRDLRAMCADAWRWQDSNPRGYETG
jgi:UDP-glucose 4-epimerase